MPISTRQKILQKIRTALLEPVAEPFSGTDMFNNIYQPIQDHISIAFAENFIALQGHFSYCLNHAELIAQIGLLFEHKNWQRFYCAELELRNIFPLEWHASLTECEVSITSCEALVARTGSIVLSAAQSMGRTASVYAPVHICIAYSHQIVPDLSDALRMLQHKYGGQLPGNISFANGPSRTADIEKTLVTGVHGPKEVYCFLVEH